MNDDVLLLKNQLCFPLYACAKEVLKRYKPFLDGIGLTYTQYIVMMVLWEQKHANVKTLGDALYLDSGTLTPLLKKMETQGLIARNRLQSDERNVVITLTEKGEALKENAASIPARMGECISLEPEEAATLYRLLYQVLGQVTT